MITTCSTRTLRFEMQKSYYLLSVLSCSSKGRSISMSLCSTQSYEDIKMDEHKGWKASMSLLGIRGYISAPMCWYIFLSSPAFDSRRTKQTSAIIQHFKTYRKQQGSLCIPFNFTVSPSKWFKDASTVLTATRPWLSASEANAVRVDVIHPRDLAGPS